MNLNLKRFIENKFLSQIFNAMSLRGKQAKKEDEIELVEISASDPRADPPNIPEAGADSDSGAVVDVSPRAVLVTEDTKDDADVEEMAEEEKVVKKKKPRITLPYNVGGKYMIEEMVSKGTFGLVYKGHRIPRPGEVQESDPEPLAIKCDRRAMREGRKVFLKTEYYVYTLLSKECGFSQVYYLGVIMQKYLLMVMELHGESLDMLVQRYNKLSLKTVIMLGVQLIDKLQIIHSRGIIHRDIKPQNIVIGRKDKQSVYIIDFGLASTYPERLEQKANGTASRFCGTIKYASVNAQYGNEQMYKDDMESLGYTFVYLLKGNLPWQIFEGVTNQERVTLAKEMKATMPIDKLCEGLPEEFGHYMSYCRNLAVREMPDYEFLKYLFKSLFNSMNYTWDDKYEWMEQEN